MELWATYECINCSNLFSTKHTPTVEVCSKECVQEVAWRLEHGLEPDQRVKVKKVSNE